MTFEDVCQEAIWEAIRHGELEPYSEVGRWWFVDGLEDDLGNEWQFFDLYDPAEFHAPRP